MHHSRILSGRGGAVERFSNRVFLRVWDDQMLMDAQSEWVQVFWKPRIHSPGYPERAEHLVAIRNGAEAIGNIPQRGWVFRSLALRRFLPARCARRAALASACSARFQVP